MNARLVPYLAAIGFDVVFAPRVDVNIRDDREVLKWARRRRRIMICHDKFKDGPTRIKIFKEVYEHGGRVIQVSSKPDRHPLTSLGLILARRRDWLRFFEEETDGMVLVHMTGMKRMDRDYCLRQFQNILIDPTPDPSPALERRRRTGQPRRSQPPPPEQAPLPFVNDGER